MELQGATPPRPLTHDLLKTVIVELGGKVESIVISDLIDDIYHARIILDANGRHVEVDSRSSDAIALAVRMKAPIYVSDKVMETGSVKLVGGEDRGERRPSESKSSSATQLDLEVYRDFIESLDILDELDK